uniref:baculoviral IAP repeat-containing protein 6-like n=1 Tax=Styela clava TaxID=7725 RepID=UPI00193A6240|nr:baculoviral IAP repeat-containing protein 6-like [Styela clava]
MDEETWFSFCDDSVPHAGAMEQLEYHASLNAVLGITKENTIKIFDENSGVTLQQVIHGTKPKKRLKCCYHKSKRSVAITDSQSVGYRFDNNGILLINTALQTPVSANTDAVILELPISDARLLTNFIQDSDFTSSAQDGGNQKPKIEGSDVDAVEELLSILVKEISNTDERDKMTLSGKWTTVKISLPYSTLKSACQTLFIPHQRRVQSIEKRSMVPGYHESSHSSYGLPIVSSMLHQLVLLNPSDNPGCHGPVIRMPSRELMYAELTRRATFTEWPHSKYKYALPHAMAEAGFYHQPAAAGDDRAMCFACNVCLVCWEPSDEPWSEHERHSPSCPFVCCEPTVNVPISVSYATQPALPNPFTNLEGSEVNIAGSEGRSKVIPTLDFITAGENSNIIAAASRDGYLATWDVSDMMPELQSISSVCKSSVFFSLRRRLKHENFPNAESFVSANYSMSNLKVTSLHILDKLAPEPEIESCDPEQYLITTATEENEEFKKSYEKSEMKVTSSAISPIIVKTPSIVVGVTIELIPRPFRGSSVHNLSKTKIGSRTKSPSKAPKISAEERKSPNIDTNITPSVEHPTPMTNNPSNATDESSNATNTSSEVINNNNVMNVPPGATENFSNAMDVLEPASTGPIENLGNPVIVELPTQSIDADKKSEVPPLAEKYDDCSEEQSYISSSGRGSPRKEFPPALESHKFSLLLFLRTEDNKDLKSTLGSKSQKQQLSMSKTTLFQPQPMEGVEIYPPPDAPMTNGVGSVSIPQSFQMANKQMMPLMELAMQQQQASDISVPPVQMNLQNMPPYLPQTAEEFEEYAQDVLTEIFPDEMAEMENELNNPHGGLMVDENANITLPDEEEDAASSGIKKKCLPATILQLVLIDHCAKPEKSDSKKQIQVINNILTTEDGCKMIVGTCPEDCFKSDIGTPQENQPIKVDDVDSENMPGLDQPIEMQDEATPTIQQPIKTDGEDLDNSQSINAEKNLRMDDAPTTPQNQPIGVQIMTTPKADQPIIAQAFSTPNVDQPMKIQEDTKMETDGNEEISCQSRGKLFVFKIEPSSNVSCVSPKEISSVDKDKSWIYSRIYDQLMILPSDFNQSSYEDEDVDSMEGEEDEQSMKENKEEQEGEKSDGSGSPTPPGSLFILGLTRDGEINVMNLATLEVVFKTNPTEIFAMTPINSPETVQEVISTTDVEPEKQSSKTSTILSDPEKFTAITYCSGTERLCASTDTGKLVFLKIGKHSPSITKPAIEGSSQPSTAPGTSTAQASDQVDGPSTTETKKTKLTPAMLIVNHPLTTENLKNLVHLTKFEPMRPRFTANAPVCWTEVPFSPNLGSGAASQTGPYYTVPQPEKAGYRRQGVAQMSTAQQQPYRRHLRHANEHYPPDAVSYTRAWRLQPDCLSWSEHLFELVFPRPTNISHIDLKFVLSRKLKPGSDIQITLLKHPGLTTSKNEILRNEQRRKWRHHSKVSATGSKKDGKSRFAAIADERFPKVMHLLTMNFVDNLMESDIENPILLVVFERKTSESMAKEWVMMDGSRKTIIAMCKKCFTGIKVGDLVVVNGYMRVCVGTSSVRIIVGALKICTEEEISSLSADELKSLEEDVYWSRTTSGEEPISNDTDNDPPSDGATGQSEEKGIEEPSAEDPDQDDDVIEDNSHASMNESPPSLIDMSGTEEHDESMNQDGSSVLFGPVNLSDYTDASGIGGVVTIASRFIIKEPRHRAVLVQIQDASSAKLVKIGSLSDEWRKRGCNRLQEISITVNKSQRTNIAHERTQRFSLMCSRSLHKKLLNGLCEQETNSAPSGEIFVAESLPQKVVALDILNWVGALETANPNERKKNSSGSDNSSRVVANTRSLAPSETLAWLLCFFDGKIKKSSRHSKTLDATLGEDNPKKVDEKNEKSTKIVDGVYTLKKFLISCFLYSGRDVSVRALRLIFNTVLCVDVSGPNSLSKSEIISGVEILSKAVLECLEMALERKVESAHGLYCLFQILSVVIATEVQKGKGQSSLLIELLEKCVSVLAKSSTLMRESIHPLHVLLRASHGLYGTPFDPERFTVEFVGGSHRNLTPPSGSTPMAVTEHATKQQSWEKYFSSEELNMQDLVTPRSLGIRRGLAIGDLIDGLSLSRFGLLDCQPLHFTCVESSEGCSVGFDTENDLESSVPNITVANDIVASSASPALGPNQHPNLYTDAINDILHWYSSPEQRTEKLKLLAEKGYCELPKTYVKKMQQDSAPKRSLPIFMEASENLPIDAELKSTSVEQKVSMNIVIPNMSFSLPPTSVLTVSRMHSGARRSVVLDFGQIVELTDVHIPSCPDISSLVLEGTKDATLNKAVFTHVGVTLDICDHDFVLSNLAPPVLCRYVRITVIGRYGTTNAQTCVSLGRFYGRPACVGYRKNHLNFDPQTAVPSPPKKSMKDSLEETSTQQDEHPILLDLLDVSDSIAGKSAVQRSIGYLRSYQDDIECRYSLACNQLRTFLSATHSGKSADSSKFSDLFMENFPFNTQSKFGKGGQMKKLTTAYKKCSRLQVQMNRVSHAIRYMESLLGGTEEPNMGLNVPHFDLPTARPPSFTQLQTFCELMLNTMLSVPHGVYFKPNLEQELENGHSALISPSLCATFFQNLICTGNPRLKVQANCLLLSYSSPFPWWGDFIAETLVKTLATRTSDAKHSSKDYMFSILLVLGQRSLATSQKAENLIKSLLKLLENLFIKAGNVSSPQNLDMGLLTWILLYASHMIETIAVQNECFMSDSTSESQSGTNASKSQEKATTEATNVTTMTPPMGTNEAGISKAFISTSKTTTVPGLAPNPILNLMGPDAMTGGIIMPSEAPSTSSLAPPKAMPPKPPTSTSKESKSKNRWKFITVSGDEGNRKLSASSGYLKVLTSMQAVLNRLKFHRAELVRLFEDKTALIIRSKTMKQAGKPDEHIQAGIEKLTSKANEHLRGIVGFRRALDRKTVLHQLFKVKPSDGQKHLGAENLPCLTEFVNVSVDSCRNVVRNVLGLLLKMDFNVPSDFVVLACKLSSQLCRWCSSQCVYNAREKSQSEGARVIPLPLFVAELVSPDEMRKLIFLSTGGTQYANSKGNSHAGSTISPGPWPNHAILSFLQDAIESENLAIVACEMQLYPIHWLKLQNLRKRMMNEALEQMSASTSEANTSQTSAKPEEMAENIKNAEKSSEPSDLIEESEIIEDKNDEHAKRLTLVDTYISSAEEFINDIKRIMVQHGEDPDIGSGGGGVKSSDSAPSPKLKKTDSSPSPKGQVYKQMRYISILRAEMDGIDVKMKVKKSPQTSSVVFVNNTSTNPMSSFLKEIRLTDVKTGKKGQMNSTGANRQLLCSHIYDSRKIHGISRQCELNQKLCTMGYLKLISKSITNPPTMVLEDDKHIEENMDTKPQPVPPYPLKTFKMLQQCFLSILDDSESHSVHLPSLLELIMLLQNCYRDVKLSSESTDSELVHLLSLKGTRALLLAVNSNYGHNFHSNPQIWSLVLNLIGPLLEGHNRIYSKPLILRELLQPEIDLVPFFVNMLSSKMAASNSSSRSFNQSISLLGTSTCESFTKLLSTFHNIVIACKDIDKSHTRQIPQLIVEYKDMLLLTLSELCRVDAMGFTSVTPSDAQIVLVEAVLEIITNEKWAWELKLWEKDVEILLMVIKNVTDNSYKYLQWSEIAVQGDSDQGVDPRSCMSGALSSILNNPTSSSFPSKIESPRDSLMLKLLKLCSELAWFVAPLHPTANVYRTAVSQMYVDPASPESVEMIDEQNKEESMDVDSEQQKMDVDDEKPTEPVKVVKKPRPFRTVADHILENHDMMGTLLSSLVMCSGSSMYSLFSGRDITPGVVIEKAASSTGDGVYVFLSGLVEATTDSSTPLKAILRYMSNGELVDGKYVSAEDSISPTCQLSMPLLWFLLSVLDTSENVSKFCALGGARLIADSLVASAKETIDQTHGQTSEVLRYLTAASDRATAFAPRAPVVLHNDSVWPGLPGSAGKTVQKITTGSQGFNYAPVIPSGNPGVKVLTSPWKENKEFDFAAVATINCSDTASQPADSLLKPKALHRRSRSPSWSYHFPTKSHWVSLQLNFPTAFILKSVKLIPMTMSLSTTPSAVMLETNRTGSETTPYIPISVPLATNGLSQIIISPPSDLVVASLKIHMKRPVDSSSIGLTRIIVNGVPNFMNYSSSSGNSGNKLINDALGPLNQTFDRRSTMNWLRLLHHCLTIDVAITPKLNNVILEVPGLIPTLCAILHQPIIPMHQTAVEMVLLQSGTSEKISELINCILRGSSGTSHFLGGLSNEATESSINLIYSLCKNRTGDIELRLSEMLKWVSDCFLLSNPEVMSLNPPTANFQHIHAIACGLWSCTGTADAKDCANLELTRTIYQWAQSLQSSQSSSLSTGFSNSSSLKNSLDWLLCCLCHVNMENYEAVLKEMGLNNMDTTRLPLSSGQIKTLTIVSQTPECIKILGNQLIVQALSNGLQKFCHRVLEVYQINTASIQMTFDLASDLILEVNVHNVIAVINFFSDLCNLHIIQDFLGSDQGMKTWQTLLTTLHQVMLVSNRQNLLSTPSSRLPRYLLLELQESTICLLKQVTKCNARNQQLFTKTLCDIVSLNSDNTENLGQLTGFVRSLLLRVVLEDEQYIVNLISGTGQKPQKGQSNSLTSGSSTLHHPMFATGHMTRTFEVGVSSTMKDIWSMASDAPLVIDRIQNKLTSDRKQSNLGTTDNKKPVATFTQHPGMAMSSYASVLKPQTPATKIAKELNNAKDFIDVLISGQNAQKKRKPKTGQSHKEEQASTPEPTKFGIPYVRLKCPSLDLEKLDDDVTLLQVISWQKVCHKIFPISHKSIIAWMSTNRTYSIA